MGNMSRAKGDPLTENPFCKSFLIILSIRFKAKVKIIIMRIQMVLSLIGTCLTGLNGFFLDGRRVFPPKLKGAIEPSQSDGIDVGAVLESLRAVKAKAVAEEDYLLAAKLKAEIEALDNTQNSLSTPPPRSSATSFELLSQRATPLHAGDRYLPPMVECPCVLPGTSLKALVKPPDADALWQWYESLGRLNADPSWAEVRTCAPRCERWQMDQCDHGQSDRSAPRKRQDKNVNRK
jgi:hypothetical protein